MSFKLILIFSSLLGVILTQSASNSIKFLTSTQFGDYISDGNNIALYIFELDSTNTSNCDNTCRATWIPFLLPVGTTASAGVGITASLVGTLTLGIGSQVGGVALTVERMQMTYNGWPLYYSDSEKNTPDVVGKQGISSVGGLWFLMSPNGKVNFSSTATLQSLTCGTLSPSCRERFKTIYLTDKTGVTLYTFENDSFLKSTCTGACANDWLPYTVNSPNSMTVGADITESLMSTITRTDGTRQVTYNGWPLYHNKNEVGMPGRLEYQDTNMHGGYWWIMDINGNVIKSDDECLAINDECVCGSAESTSFLANAKNFIQGTWSSIFGSDCKSKFLTFGSAAVATIAFLV
jgi:predicted lipoprotein with Yx(FWY)xxD motif